MDPKQAVGLLPILKGIQNTMKTKQEPELKKQTNKKTWINKQTKNMNKQTNKNIKVKKNNNSRPKYKKEKFKTQTLNKKQTMDKTQEHDIYIMVRFHIPHFAKSVWFMSIIFSTVFRVPRSSFTEVIFYTR